jgi:hypothetical protein
LKEKDVLYFGSYGSGATCLSGLIKVQPGFKQFIEGGLKINDFLNKKQRLDFSRYEQLKSNRINKKLMLGKVSEYKTGDNVSYTLNFCDKGCLISNYKNLDYCPKGHPGKTTYTFPYYTILDTGPIEPENPKDYNFYKRGLVRIDPSAEAGDVLELELRRIDMDYNDEKIKGYIDWAPYYIPSLFKSN